MADSRKLTSDEVNALMEGLSKGDVSAEAGVGKDLEVAPFSLSLIHISEPTRLLSISYAVFCLKKKKR